jgi:helicase
MDTTELMSLGFPPKLVEIWQRAGIVKLLPIQAEAILDYGLLDAGSGNLLVIAPTSSGKTLVGEIAAVKEASEMRKAIFLVPFKAIAEEMYADFEDKYGEYGLRIAISDSDHREYDEDILQADYDIAVIVYEKLAGLLVADPEFLSNTGLIVADEIQMIMEPGRGPSIELLMTKILSLESGTRIIALSAVLERLNDFDKWMNARVLFHKTRPVELREAIYSKDGLVEYREFNSRGKGTAKLSAWTDENDGLLKLAELIIASNEQVLVFCATKSSTVAVARKIAANLRSPVAATETIRLSDELPDTFEKVELLNLLHASVAYHDSDLSLEERLLIEQGFRRKEIKILTCTSTLSMGVNLPAGSVVLFEPRKWNGDRFIPITVAEYKNMAGRAGRYSLQNAFGTSYLLSSSQSSADALRTTYVEGKLEGFSSAFGDQVIALQVLDIVAGQLAKTSDEVADFVFRTFNGKFKWKTEQARNAIHEMIISAIQECVEAGAIEITTRNELRITPAGRLCASGGFSLDHLEHATECLVQLKEVIDLEMIYWALATDYKCSKSAYFISKVKGDAFRSQTYQRMLAELSKTERVGQSLDRLADQPGTATYDEVVVLRRALACYAWISDLPTKRITEMFPDVAFGAIRNTADVCVRLLAFLFELAKLSASEQELQRKLTSLAERLSRGATRESLSLAKVHNTGLSRDERNHLVQAGLGGIDDLIDMKIEDIPLSRTKALRLIKAIEVYITDDQERRKRSQRARLNAMSIETSKLEAVYAKSGKELESAIDEMLKAPFLGIVCRPVGHQNEGEPDHVLYTAEGKPVVIQTTARDRKRVNMTKATSVIGQSSKYKPIGYIVLGRPDFDELSIRDSANQVAAGLNYKLIPIYALAEMFVLFHERKLTVSDVERILLDETGYIGTKELQSIVTRGEDKRKA